MKVLSSLFFMVVFPALSCGQTDDTTSTDGDGFHVHRLPSPYQGGDTTLRVLLPDNVKAGRRYRVLYVLPVIEHGKRRYGDGLLEVKKYGYHNSHNMICVAPEFSSKPWFADHDLNPQKQDESHLIRTVLPFVEKQYPALRAAEGRLLIGFSKSGWGALSLLLRNPDLFHKAAGWDIGIRVDTGPIEEADRAERIAREWGTVENFKAYRISALVKTKGRELGDKARLFYFSTEGIRAQGGVEIHRLLVEHRIPHRYVFEPHRTHRWDSGWIPEAFGFLVDPD